MFRFIISLNKNKSLTVFDVSFYLRRGITRKYTYTPSLVESATTPVTFNLTCETSR